VKRRVQAAVVLLSCADLVAVAVLYSGSLATPGAARPGAPGLPESDSDGESQELDRQLQSTDAHRELLVRLSTDLIAGRCTLSAAATELADFSRQSKPEWLRGAGKRYPGRPEQASVACALVYFTLFRLRDAADEETARRLAADYLACYGLPLTLPDGRGGPLPPCWRAAGPGTAGGS
jgi:hypothetical protein